jgi:hypothetical protein
MWDNATAQLAQRVNTLATQTSFFSGKTVGGASVFLPLLMTTNIYGTSNPRWIGRPFQILLVPSDLGYGAEVDVPIDAGVTGKFRVIARNAELYGNLMVAVRRTS